MLTLVARSMPRHAASAAISDIKLYQYAICPFCNKAKAALNYLKVPYETKEVNPLTRGEIKGLIEGYSKVPIAVFGQSLKEKKAAAGEAREPEAVKESMRIVQRAIEEYTNGARGVAGGRSDLDTTHFFSKEALEWHDWADQKFAVAMYPNITRNLKESFESLGYVSKYFGPLNAFLIRYVGAAGMTFAHGKICRKYGFEATQEREYLWDKVIEWEVEVDARGGKFRGGDKPDISDISVYGCVDGLKELPIYKEILDTHPEFAEWMARMDKEVAS